MEFIPNIKISMMKNPFRKSGFLYSALQSPIQYCVVAASDIEICSLLNQNPLKHSKKSKIFFAIRLNLLINYGH